MGTDFQFGWNDPANNLAPWGKTTEPGRTQRCRNGGPRSGVAESDAKPLSDSDPGSVSIIEDGGWWFFGVCSDALQVDAFEKTVWLHLNLLKEEMRRMLPRSNAAPSAPVRTGSMNWLKVEMLSKQPKEAKILMVKAGEGKFGAKVTLKMAFDGQTVYDSITVKNNPNYVALEAAFGNDENDWINQKVLIGLEQDGFSDQFFKRYSVATNGKKGK
jgi:hypothetical protein